VNTSQTAQTDQWRDPFGPVGHDDASAVVGTVRTPLVTQILTIARRRKWIIVGTVLGCLLAGIIITLLMTPRYTAVTSVEIQRESGGVADADSSSGQRATQFIDPEFYETQYGILKSKALAVRVATDLRLYDNATFLKQNKIGPDTWFSGNRVNPAGSKRDDRINAVAGLLLGSVEIDPIKLSRLVQIKATSLEPEMAQRIANMWAADYIQVTLDRRYNASGYARRYLEQRLAQLRERINTSERRLVDYARREGIVNLPAVGTGTTGTGSNERSLAVDDLVSLNTELASAVADRIRAEARLQGPAANSSDALANGTLSTLRTRRAELNADYARMMTQFAPDYPPARALKNQIDQIDRSIGREEQRAGSSVSETYRASVARENALKTRVNQLKSSVLDFRNRSIEYNIIQRDVDTSRQLYDGLLQRYRSIGTGGVGLTNISIVDEADLPGAPSSPKTLLNLVAALLIGMVLGAAGAFVAEQLDQGIAEPDDVQRYLGAPLLGTIPKDREGTAAGHLLDRKSAISEAYISLQTNLSFATAKGMPRSLAVTSTRSAEGKSTTSFALAIMIARARHSVVLVDMDMRSPSVHAWFDATNGAGVSNYLSGGSDISPLIQTSSIQNLSFISAGPTPPSAPELLSGDRLETLISDLFARFDYVVFDAPPVMGLADAPLIAARAEGTVFVFEAGSTQRKMAQVALDRLRATHANVTGVVLTKFDARRANVGYGYGYGYGYSYGKGDA
jgi:succinoglycan biosynthesis transport protein ExoP